MTSTLPESPDEMADLRAVAKRIRERQCDLGDELAKLGQESAMLLRLLGASPQPSPFPDTTEGIPECYSDPVAERVRARRRRLRESGLRAVG